MILYNIRGQSWSCLLIKLANDTRRVKNSAMGTAAECTNCHVLPSIELNLTKAKFIRGRVNSQQPVSRMFVYIIRRRDRTPFCFISSILSKLEVSRKRLYMDYIYPGCMSYLVKYVLWKYSSPNECDKILKIQNKQTEPTDYMANCSTDI